MNPDVVHGNGRAVNTMMAGMVAALLASGCGGGAPATADVPAALDAPDAAVIVTPIDVPVVSRDAHRVDRPPTSRCDDGQRDCYPLGCRDLLNDRQTCGSCNRSCESTERCVEGSCVPLAAGLSYCGEEVVSLLTDHRHCARCDHACEDNERCEGGRCVALPAGQVLCGEEAVVLASNDRHCGGCGRRCAEGERCIRGACGPLRCDSPLLLCVEGEPCVDPSNDAIHCGACGRACAAGERCMGGECVCQLGLTRCGDRCVDLLSDRDRCGSCERACPVGDRCLNGECACPSGTTRCGDRCVDLRSDRENCGTCGVRACGETICHNGRVLEFCSPGTIVCPSMSETCTVCYSPRNCEGLCGGCCGSCTFGVCRNGVCVDR